MFCVILQWLTLHIAARLSTFTEFRQEFRCGVLLMVKVACSLFVLYRTEDTREWQLDNMARADVSGISADRNEDVFITVYIARTTCTVDLFRGITFSLRGLYRSYHNCMADRQLDFSNPRHFTFPALQRARPRTWR